MVTEIGRLEPPPPLTSLGRDEAAVIATQQARLVGNLQHDRVNEHTESAAQTLQQLARPTTNWPPCSADTAMPRAPGRQ